MDPAQQQVGPVENVAFHIQPWQRMALQTCSPLRAHLAEHTGRAPLAWLFSGYKKGQRAGHRWHQHPKRQHPKNACTNCSRFLRFQITGAFPTSRLASGSAGIAQPPPRQSLRAACRGCRHANRQSHLRQLGRAKAASASRCEKVAHLVFANQADEGQILLLPLAAQARGHHVQVFGVAEARG